MKCVCRRRCQVRNKAGRIITYAKGQVDDFDKCPTWFAPIEGDDAQVLDFLTASEEELMAAKWKFADAAIVIKSNYNVTLKREEGTKKSEVVDQILDARYRSVQTADTDHTR